MNQDMNCMIPKRRSLCLALASGLTAALAGHSQVLGAEKEKQPVSSLSVEIPGLVMPVARNGNLINYLFVIVRVEVGDSGSADFLRQKHFLVRDAVVKVASKSPLREGAQRGTYDMASLRRVVDIAIKALRPGIVIRQIEVERGDLMR
jgi:hypothetical protein